MKSIVYIKTANNTNTLKTLPDHAGLSAAWIVFTCFNLQKYHLAIFVIVPASFLH